MDEATLHQQGDPTAAEYGVSVRFAEGSPLDFPDLRLVFVGYTLDTVTGHRRWRFKATSVHDSTEVVAYTGGVIAPQQFALGERSFSLELDRVGPSSQLTLHRLDDNP